MFVYVRADNEIERAERCEIFSINVESLEWMMPQAIYEPVVLIRKGDSAPLTQEFIPEDTMAAAEIYGTHAGVHAHPLAFQPMDSILRLHSIEFRIVPVLEVM